MISVTILTREGNCVGRIKISEDTASFLLIHGNYIEGSKVSDLINHSKKRIRAINTPSKLRFAYRKKWLIDSNAFIDKLNLFNKTLLFKAL